MKTIYSCMECGNDCKPRKTIFGWTFYYCKECGEWKFRSGVFECRYNTIGDSIYYLKTRIRIVKLSQTREKYLRENIWNCSKDDWATFEEKWEKENKVEIISNKFENPELLEAEK